MNLNQFRNMFADEGSCRRYLEQVIWPSGQAYPPLWLHDVLVT